MGDGEWQSPLFADMGAAGEDAPTGGGARPRGRSARGGGSLSVAGGETPASAWPLAARMRPLTLGPIVGQQHLLAPGRAPRPSIASDHAASVILWGPPGSGKTTPAAGAADA